MKASTKTMLTVVLVVVASLVSGRADAVPTCTSTLIAPGGNGTFDMTQLTPGVCVQAQDKLFGNFTFGNVPTTGTVAFTLNVIGSTDVHQIAFNSTYLAGTTYTGLGFQVEVNPPGPVITELDADFTQTHFGPSTLTKNANPAGNNGNPIIETKVGTVVTFCSTPLPGGVCGETYSPGVTDITVSESLVDNGTISSITDTVIEQLPKKAPEPASLLLIGAGLVGLGLIRRRRK